MNLYVMEDLKLFKVDGKAIDAILGHAVAYNLKFSLEEIAIMTLLDDCSGAHNATEHGRGKVIFDNFDDSCDSLARVRFAG